MARRLESGVEQRRSGNLVIIIILMVLGMLCLYVLSVGPAVYLINTGAPNDELVESFYTPLLWIANHRCNER